MKIYTRRGDAGETGLFGGGRVPKDDPRVEAYGAVDELAAVLGWAITQVRDEAVREHLQSIQPDLFAIGARLATPPPAGVRRGPVVPELPSSRVDQMEAWIDEVEATLPELRAFIVPGGSAGGAALHVARTVCRRAERRTVALFRSGGAADVILVYLNRLSDLLFVLARAENRSAGEAERPWRPEEPASS